MPDPRNVPPEVKRQLEAEAGSAGNADTLIAELAQSEMGDALQDVDAIAKLQREHRRGQT